MIDRFAHTVKMRAYLLLFLATVCVSANDDKAIADFLERYKSIDVTEIIKNDRLFLAYHQCFMDAGPCTPEARELKALLPTLVKTSCETCSMDTKKEMKKHLNYAKGSRTAEWNEILHKYDPNEESLNKFLASVPDD